MRGSRQSCWDRRCSDFNIRTVCWARYCFKESREVVVRNLLSSAVQELRLRIHFCQRLCMINQRIMVVQFASCLLRKKNTSPLGWQRVRMTDSKSSGGLCLDPVLKTAISTPSCCHVAVRLIAAIRGLKYVRHLMSPFKFWNKELLLLVRELTCRPLEKSLRWIPPSLFRLCQARDVRVWKE